MADDVTSQPSQYDEALAQYVDQLLEGIPPDEMRSGTEDPALLELQQTVEFVWEALSQMEPDHPLRDRIHQNLVAEWRDNAPAHRSGPFWKDWLPSLPLGSSSVVRGGMMLAAAVSILLIIIGVGLAAGSSTSPLTGAAAGTGSVMLISVGAAGLLIVFVWLLRNNRA